MAHKTEAKPKTTSRKAARRVEAPRVAVARALDPDRAHRIAEAAYFIAAARGFAPGNELDDWLAAERAVDQA